MVVRKIVAGRRECTGARPWAHPAFVEETKRAGIQLKPLTGERLQEVVASVAQFPPAMIAKARVAREKPN